MALSQSALSELLEAFRAGDGVDLIRESVRAGAAGADRSSKRPSGSAPDRYERTEDRVTDRNGTRPRLLSTKAGDVELRIPKLRKGSFFPVILEPRRRIDQALYAVVMEAYVHGISTRSVDDLVDAMGVDAGISKSEVSRICAGAGRGRSARSAPGRWTTPSSPTSTSTRPTCTSATARQGRPGGVDGGRRRHRDRRRRLPGGPRPRRRRQRGRDVLARLPDRA